MRFRHLNFVHLVYLVAVAREGSVSRAASALHVSPQTISGQLRVFGQRLGGPLTQRVGRGIELTPLGRDVATRGAVLLDQGEALLSAPAADRAGTPVVTVGVSLIVQPLLARKWLQPLYSQPGVERIVCVEGRERDLWEQLAVRSVDVVIASGTPPVSRGFRTVLLGRSPIALFGSAAFARRYRGRLRQALREAPMLVPTEASAARRVLEAWLQLEGVTPRIAGEFDDTSLRDAFAAAGLGVCFAPALLAREMQHTYALKNMGIVRGPEARYFAVARAPGALLTALAGTAAEP